jgi:hypothetical protein
MNKGSRCAYLSREFRPEGVGVEASAGTVVAAEISSYSERLVEVAGQRAIAAVEVGAAVEPGKLVSAEHLSFRMIRPDGTARPSMTRISCAVAF